MLFFHATNRKSAHVRHVRPADQQVDSRIWANSKVQFFIINLCNSNRVISKFNHDALKSSNIYWQISCFDLYPLRSHIVEIFALFIYSGFPQPGLFICPFPGLSSLLVNLSLVSKFSFIIILISSYFLYNQQIYNCTDKFLCLSKI